MIHIPLLVKFKLFTSCIISLLLIAPGSHYGQVIPNYDATPVDYSLIPVIKDNRIGFVNRKNIQVIAPKYDAVSFFNTDGFAVIRLGGLDGIIDKTGNELIPPFKKSGNNLRQANNIGAKSAITPLSGIFYYHNETTSKWMLFAPGKSKSISSVYPIIKPRFDDRIEYSSRSTPDNSNFVFGYKKIVRQDAQVNFIDTNFNEILRIDIVNGFPLNDQLFAVYNDAGKAGIYKKDGSLVMDHILHGIQYCGHPDYFIISVMKNTGYPLEGIIDKTGKLIIDTIYSNVSYLRYDHFEITQASNNYSSKKGIITVTGKVIIPAEYPSFNPYGPNAYIALSAENDDKVNFKDGKYFILDFTGKIIAGPFRPIRWRDEGTIATTTRNDSILFLDLQGKIKFKLQGEFSVKESNDYGMILNIDGKQSLISLNGKVLLEPAKTHLGLLKIADWVEVNDYDANMRGIFSFSKGWIFPMNGSTSQIRYTPATENDPNNVLYVNDGLNEYTYTNTEKNVSKKLASKETGASTRFIVNKDTAAIRLISGIVYKYPTQEDLDVHTNGHELYFEKRENKERILLNANLKPLFPEGYTRQSTIEINNAYVFHIANKALQGGLYSLEGKWLYGPVDNMTRAEWLEGTWALGTHTNCQLYSRDFKKLNNKTYEPANIRNPSFLIYKEREKNTLDIFSRKSQLLSEGVYSGFTGFEGDFVGVEQAGNGDLLSCITDSLMKEVACFPYASIRPLKGNSDYFIVKDLYDYGIINRKGEIIIPCLYKDIVYDPVVKIFMIYKGDKTVDIMTTSGQFLIKKENHNFRKTVLNEKYMAIMGEQYTYILNTETGSNIKYPSALGTFRWDKDLLSQRLVYFTKDNKNIYADVDSTMVYQIP